MGGAWIRCSRGELVYAGRITRAPFTVWTRTVPGRTLIEETARHIRFSLLGRRRSAARRLWREVAYAARHPAVVRVVQEQADRYLQRLGELAYAHGLPRVGIELRRLVVVPAVLLNG